MQQRTIQLTEHQLQSLCAEWWRLKELTDDRYSLIYAVPNGGSRSKGAASKIKKEGGRRGVWDINVDVPAKGYHGLRIEMKIPSGKLTPEQTDMGLLFVKYGYLAVVCRTFEDFKRLIESYFE